VLTLDDHRVTTVESLSELTSPEAFERCDDKRATRDVLEAAGLAVAPGRVATFDDADDEFLARWADIVVKPSRGEQGWGITVGVTSPEQLAAARAEAQRIHPEVLLERRCPGDDLRVIVIGREVVAAAVRRPATVVGDGVATIGELTVALSERRSAETAGAAQIPLDETTRLVVADAGYTFDSVLAGGVELQVRRTANVHTGGTIDDITDVLHPVVAAAACAAADAIDIPVVGIDFMVPAVDGPDYVIIEANEQPGLANHEPRPTAARFIDLLFPESASAR
jgi:GNAT-family acetyltransferase (TIGR03103 family)